MGLGGISIWQLVIVLLIVIMLFGSKRLKSLGGDIGGAIKGFKNSIRDDSSNVGDLIAEDTAKETDRELNHSKV